MRNKKMILLIIGLALVIIVTIITLICKNNSRSVDELLNQLETAINTCNQDKLIDCYPDFMQEDIKQHLSLEKMKEFHSEVGDITISSYTMSNFKAQFLNDEENQINEKYGLLVSVNGYELLAEVSYHKAFEKPTWEIIKIDNKWYLYESSCNSSPICYFIE